ncbi:hypothetical protein K2173_028588 [Erythroxylum novogranatense]|uniref:PH domain-containing protein n=1 Tax=Erythroxylum novogranatense TaxID=1862640 RepID=A0AAV8U2B6_9ROSI|nr:hypothetical protein K2173_028588 [Erythroxylum novogranatense]
MHQLCCISTVSDHSPLPDISMAITSRSHPNARSTSSAVSEPHVLSSTSLDSNGNIRWIQQVDGKPNGFAGNGISGVLHKWVNYGKGWRSRWFVLQDGVFSYYKIDGHDKIAVNLDTQRGSNVIGEEPMKRISSTNSVNSHFNRKPIGEIHLKVSSICASGSDDKRFSIFTGTKRLHLRAETREDRNSWVEALQAVKGMFPRMSNSELMAPSDNVAVSTEKLRQRLQEEGIRAAAIQDCDQIMRSEFTALQNQIVVLKQKQSLLIDKMRQLEVHVTQCREQNAIRTQSFSTSISVSTVSTTLKDC